MEIRKQKNEVVLLLTLLAKNVTTDDYNKEEGDNQCFQNRISHWTEKVIGSRFTGRTAVEPMTS